MRLWLARSDRCAESGQNSSLPAVMKCGSSRTGIRCASAKETIDGISVDRLLFLSPAFDYLAAEGRTCSALRFFRPAESFKIERGNAGLSSRRRERSFSGSPIPFILKLRREFAFYLVVSLHGHDVERLDPAQASENGDERDSNRTECNLNQSFAKPMQ